RARCPRRRAPPPCPPSSSPPPWPPAPSRADRQGCAYRMLDIHVVSHTHWDREWYLTYEQFRFRLVTLIDRVLDLLDADPSYKHFHLDGQTIVLEDYLEIRPEQEPRLRRATEEGRILIGPWYVMPDEFLVSGESLVRNVLRGHRISRQFGS